VAVPVKYWQDFSMPRRRKTLVDVLFTICLTRFVDDGWKLKKSLIARSGAGKTLATTDAEGKAITLCPKIIGENDPPLEMTLLHELIHVGFNLEGKWDINGVTYWLERYMWRKLTVEQKATLTKMIEEA
jgi:hypothetical protein